jgi:hypothetical protein
MTGDWVPDHELARLGGLPMDPATRGPVVHASLATGVPGVFAAGNLVHPVDTADGAALDGRHVAGAVTSWLRDGSAAPSAAGLELRVEPPLRWVTPQRVDATGGVRAPRGLLLTWVDEYRRVPVVRATQQGSEVGRVRTPWPAAPGRVFRVPDRVLAGADPAHGPVTLAIR